MDLKKLLDLASEVADAAGAPDLVQTGITIAGQLSAYVAEVEAAADRAKVVIDAGTQADFDAIHAVALDVNTDLDGKLADAAKR